MNSTALSNALNSLIPGSGNGSTGRGMDQATLILLLSSPPAGSPPGTKGPFTIEQATLLVNNLAAGGGNTRTTINGPNGSVTTTSSGSAAQAALSESTQNINDAIKTITKDNLNVAPTISVDQGTKIKVFVQRDLLFPQNSVGYGKVVQ
jgi:hypothetical protein